MRFFRPCIILGWLYPDAIFRIRTTEKLLYLSFDDGPNPDSTPLLLDLLARYNVKVMFFCNGKAAKKYPDLIDKIVSGGHIIGNHGYNHLNGWITSLDNYTADVENAALYTSSGLFRPPYGRLRFDQYRKLKIKYKIVFWDIMPYDFDRSFGSDKSLKILQKKQRPGSIVVLHDKPQSTAITLLGQFIELSGRNGYRFILPDL